MNSSRTAAFSRGLLNVKRLENFFVACNKIRHVAYKWQKENFNKAGFGCNLHNVMGVLSLFTRLFFPKYI